MTEHTAGTEFAPWSHQNPGARRAFPAAMSLRANRLSVLRLIVVIYLLLNPKLDAGTTWAPSLGGGGGGGKRLGLGDELWNSCIALSHGFLNSCIAFSHESGSKAEDEEEFSSNTEWLRLSTHGHGEPLLFLSISGTVFVTAVGRRRSAPTLAPPWSNRFGSDVL
eukprot:CAMPEP_0181441020 /NCGR_PEP_ID=MMETSP1110-20121109/23283_2 /TAXON_ID=174948 /ORGANISM="Symbiodinium sp., Strain CCMP421" /LENGTH=164 /DNA_ID=CAMNT_0023564873 /DNA_START=452 /DNA_END=947 /DNA_ORIENTATION=-